jgi:hypothetical protein
MKPPINSEYPKENPVTLVSFYRDLILNAFTEEQKRFKEWQEYELKPDVEESLIDLLLNINIYTEYLNQVSPLTTEQCGEIIKFWEKVRSRGSDIRKKIKIDKEKGPLKKKVKECLSTDSFMSSQSGSVSMSGCVSFAQPEFVESKEVTGFYDNLLDSVSFKVKSVTFIGPKLDPVKKEEVKSDTNFKKYNLSSLLAETKVSDRQSVLFSIEIMELTAEYLKSALLDLHKAGLTIENIQFVYNPLLAALYLKFLQTLKYEAPHAREERVWYCCNDHKAVQDIVVNGFKRDLRPKDYKDIAGVPFFTTALLACRTVTNKDGVLYLIFSALAVGDIYNVKPGERITNTLSKKFFPID